MSRLVELLSRLGVESLPVIMVSLIGFADGIGERAVVSEVVDAVIDDVAEMQLWAPGSVRCSCSTLQPSLEHAATVMLPSSLRLGVH